MQRTTETERNFLLQEKYSGVITPEYERDIKKLEAGEPLAYVIGFVPFLGTKIFLDSQPLIPRSETEHWAEKAIAEIASRNGSVRVLDLFAGSGCIGVAVAKHVPDAHVDFGEIDEAHFPTIQKNIDENIISPDARFQVLKTDVWSGVPDSYDYILANPPYLSPLRRNRAEESVLKHEPEGALFAAEEGFALIRETILGAEAHLNPGGALYIEHEPEQAEPLSLLAEENGFTAENRKDQYGVLRYSVLKRF